MIRAIFSSPDSGVDSEFDDTSTADEQIAHLFENSRSDDKRASSLTPDPTRMSLVMPTPLTSASLAPAPRKEEIFGRCPEFISRIYFFIQNLIILIFIHIFQVELRIFAISMKEKLWIYNETRKLIKFGLLKA